MIVFVIRGLLYKVSKEQRMTIMVDKSDDGKMITIKLPNEFDFRVHKDFRETHKDVASGSQFILDFSSTEHMDSSALGMLLLMREELGYDVVNIKFINCRPNIKSLLDMASFNKLFDVT